MIDSKRTPNYEPKRGSLKRASGEVLYVLYGAGEQECLVFVQSQTSLYLTGDLCAPARQKIGKSRAEALIRSLGFNPAIPIEPLPELSTLPVD